MSHKDYTKESLDEVAYPVQPVWIHQDGHKYLINRRVLWRMADGKKFAPAVWFPDGPPNTEPPVPEPRLIPLLERFGTHPAPVPIPYADLLRMAAERWLPSYEFSHDEAGAPKLNVVITITDEKPPSEEFWARWCVAVLMSRTPPPNSKEKPFHRLPGRIQRRRLDSMLGLIGVEPSYEPESRRRAYEKRVIEALKLTHKLASYKK